MDHIRIVLKFGVRYLPRYWTRVLAALALSLIFALSNAGFVWGTQRMMDRLQASSARPAPSVEGAAKVAKPTARSWGVLSDLERRTRPIREWTENAFDRWMPRAGRPLDWRQLLGGLLLLPGFVLIRGLTDYLSSYCLGWVSERVVNELRLDLLKKLSGLSLGFFHQSRTGDLLTRINSDTLSLLRCLQSGMADLVKEVLSLICVLGYLLWINWQLTLLSMISIPLVLGPMLVLGRKARKASRASTLALVEQSNQLVDLFSGIRIIKAYNLEAQQLEAYRRLSTKLVQQGIKGVQARSMVNPVIQVISTVWLGALVVYIFMTRGSVSDFVGFLTGLMLVYVPMRKLAAVHILFEQASVGIQRIDELLRQTVSVPEPVAPRPLSRFQAQIRFHCVHFAYEPGRPVLHDIDLVLARGQRIGVAGASGSGKSTLVNLLFRFYDPTQGAVTLDGMDLREVSLRDLRNLMSLVSQDVILFDQTVAENIALGRLGATLDEVEAAARAAAAHEFILRLPKGYATRIGERGLTLSGGQRQRLALARAFVRNAPILVLDEATASLDSKAESEIQAAIELLEEDRTVLCVAHRLSTLTNMDEIVVIDDGRIVERGSFDRLLRGDTLLARMAAQQGISRRQAAIAD